MDTALIIRMYFTYLTLYEYNPKYPVKGLLPFVQRRIISICTAAAVTSMEPEFWYILTDFSPQCLLSKCSWHIHSQVIQHKTPQGAHILSSVSQSLDLILKSSISILHIRPSLLCVSYTAYRLFWMKPVWWIISFTAHALPAVGLNACIRPQSQLKVQSNLLDPELSAASRSLHEQMEL